MQSLVSDFYNANSRNAQLTIFVSGCIFHRYIVPLDMRYRRLALNENMGSINEKLIDIHAISIGGIGTVYMYDGPYIWNEISFGSSIFHRNTTYSQYNGNMTLGEMVQAWSKSVSVPDIAGFIVFFIVL